MTRPVTFGEDVALFIDWENFKISLATGHRTPNVSALKEEVSHLGRVVVAKAYADWVSRAPELRGASQFINDPPALYAAGIEPVYVPTRIFTGRSGSSDSSRGPRVKNSVDIKMTADFLECAHSYPNIGTYVLVSGDSDFIHVVNTLRTMGKRVVIIGVSWSTSRRLADQVDGLILYDVDVDPVTAPEPVATDNGRPPTTGDEGDRVELVEVIREIEEIVRTERRAGGTPLLTSIKQRLMRRFPNFDEKQLGFSGFKKLMSRVAQGGNIKLITAGLVDWAIMADESGPTEGGIGSIGLGETRRAGIPGRRFAPAKSAPVVEKRFEAQEDQHPPPILPGPEDTTEEFVESPVAPVSPALEALLFETTANLHLPQGPGDGLDSRRIADLIVMTDTLEHREGISHVAFNFLVAEVCQALEQGLEANYGEITQSWSQVYSRAYVAKMFRGLSEANLFKRGWHSSRDETSGVQRRRRTFNLDRDHIAVEQVLKSRLVPDPGEHDVATTEFSEPQESSRADEGYHASGLADASQPEEADTQQPGKVEAPFFSRLFRGRRGD
jgi:uncharacterized LabA/DUF88 family protein